MTSFTEVATLAARGVTRNLRRTLITGAMIALGVAAVVFARGFIAGLQVMMTESLIEMRYGSFELSRRGYHESAELAPLDLDLPATGPLRNLLAATSGVEAVTGRLRFVGMASKGDTTQVVSGLGLEPGAEARVCTKGPASRFSSAGARGERYMLVEGEGLGADDGVVLGPELAQSLEAHLGDTITLLGQTQSGSMDAVDVRVVGIYRWDQPEENRRALIVTLALAQRLLHMPGRVTAFGMRCASRAAIEPTVHALRAKLSGRDPAVELLTWSDLGPYLRDVMILQNRVLGVVMAIIFALLLTGVTNTMLMSVFERTREVGTLMCLGMRRRQIVALFLLEAFFLAVLAALAGTALGLAVVVWTHYTGIAFFIPAVGTIVDRPLIDLTYVALAFGAALASALGAALYPAWRASRLRPVDALRAT